MLRLFKRENATSPVETLINTVLEGMRNSGPYAVEYPAQLELLERLYKLKAQARRAPVSSDTIALVAGNLMGILLIVAYEQKHVMTSKGFGHIIKPK
jgi:hypothetical protein